jgi:UDP-GlcNAc:undecaprenyl-phosphate/decaprenyl-phosphate GlcNAc-1-phosphate transferase
MPGALISVLTVVIAALTAALMVPAINAFAVRSNFLDVPDGVRHNHARPVPRLGGVAVFVGLLVAVSLTALVSPSFAEATPWALPLNRALVGASAILFCIGLLDDLRGVSPGLKLIGQTAAAVLVIAFGFQIERIAIIPGSEFSLGIFSMPVTILWLVGVSNAFNLIDGIDGLAGGVGVIALVAIGASAIALGGTNVPLQCMALAGALLGFLRFNMPPARIFLGDSGSLVVGFLLAFLAVKGSTNTDGVVYALVPIFALSYLLLDTGIAIMRRWLRGTPLSRADGRHIHHQLLSLGLSPKRAIGVIYLETAFIALLGLCVTFVPPRMTLAITTVGLAALLLIFLYGIRWLEYHEFLEAGASFASGVRKARGSIQDRIAARDLASQLRNARTMDEVNASVRNSAPAFRFVHMEVQIDSPTGVTVHAPDHIGSATWLLEYPIFAPNGNVVRSTPEPVLAIWCPVTQTGRPASPERVAQILAPAIAHALSQATDIGPSSESAPPAVKRRASGAHTFPIRRVSSEHRRISTDAVP